MPTMPSARADPKNGLRCAKTTRLTLSKRMVCCRNICTTYRCGAPAKQGNQAMSCRLELHEQAAAGERRRTVKNFDRTSHRLLPYKSFGAGKTPATDYSPSRVRAPSAREPIDPSLHTPEFEAASDRMRSRATRVWRQIVQADRAVSRDGRGTFLKSHKPLESSLPGRGRSAREHMNGHPHKMRTCQTAAVGQWLS